MAGFLSKKQRLDIIRLIQGILLDDQDSIGDAVIELSEDDRNDAGDRREQIEQKISDVLEEPEYLCGHLLYKTFYLVDRLAVRGTRFHRDLLVFRKSFFTVEGLLQDLDPTFDMDGYLTQSAGELAMSALRPLEFLVRSSSAIPMGGFQWSPSSHISAHGIDTHRRLPILIIEHL